MTPSKKPERDCDSMEVTLFNRGWNAAIAALNNPPAAQPAPVQEQVLGFDVVLDESLPSNTMKFVQPAPVPLTDERIGKVWAVAEGEHNASASVKRRITRSIEAAHGIKEKNT